jgi:hypothetical protein
MAGNIPSGAGRVERRKRKMQVIAPMAGSRAEVTLCTESDIGPPSGLVKTGLQMNPQKGLLHVCRFAYLRFDMKQFGYPISARNLNRAEKHSQ